MEALKNLWQKLNPKVAVVSGVLVLTTSVGTCQFQRAEPTDSIAPITEDEPAAEIPAEPAEVTEVESEDEPEAE